LQGFEEPKIEVYRTLGPVGMTQQTVLPIKFSLFICPGVSADGAGAGMTRTWTVKTLHRSKIS